MQYWARLRTSLAPDAIDVGDREIRPGGFAVLGAVAKALAEMRFGRPRTFDAGDRGWEQFSRRGDFEIWSQVTWFGDDRYLLGVAYRPSLFGKVALRRFVDEVLVPLDKKLRTDERFFEVSWIVPEEIMGEGGATNPADPALLARLRKKG